MSEEGKIQQRTRADVEKLILLFYFIGSVAMTVIFIKSGWPIWMAVLTDVCWGFAVILYAAKVQDYVFRAIAVTSLMLIGAVLWSIASKSLFMTIPVLSMLAVLFVFYGVMETIYVTVPVSVFLCIYHVLIERTVDLSSGMKILQMIVGIISVFFIEYVTHIMNKKRLDGMEKQLEIIDSLKQAERSKDDFMANLSHEIRTPINTICGMSEMILREDLEEQVRSDVFSIQTAGRNLQSIVSDVLDFTEMQSGKMVIVEESYNITSTINDVINMSMARKNERNLDLVVDCSANLPSGLRGDEQKIRRVIMNLVNNALKFTTEGCVTIVINARNTDYGINLIVAVKDTGIGMKKESMEKLFTSFNQVDTKRNRQREGIGLGLAISQAMVDMMGGFITVSSEFGRGTEIQFVIPQKVVDSTPIAVVKNPERVNVAIYVNMEQYDRPEIREAYGHVIFHMIAQLHVKAHVCQNLEELKRRAERESFTHIFISVEEYEEDERFFDSLAGDVQIIVIIERINAPRVANPKIQCLYKPFFILPIVMALNDEKLVQDVEVNPYYHHRFISPDTNVLIVDDNLMNIRVLEGLLQPYKIKTAIATSGAEALEKIENMNYDVVFMDHMMPEMDGIETFHRIRQKQGNYFKKIPIIAVTANAVGGMREVFLKEGFQDFIAKPIEVSVLDRVLRRNLPQEKLIVQNEAEEGQTDEVLDAAADGGFAGQGESLSETAEPGRIHHTDLPTEYFDEQMGIQYCGDMENYIEVMRLTSRAGQEDWNRIRQFYEEKDWKNYTTLVHALKSTMLSIGVEKLSGMAKELELAGKRDDVEFIAAHHEDMMEEYSRILALMKKSRTLYPDRVEESLEGLEPIEVEELDKLALEFEDAAFAFEHGRMTAIAERLMKCSLCGRPLKEKMKPVMRKIQMSDYLSAAEVIARLKDMLKEDA